MQPLHHAIPIFEQGGPAGLPSDYKLIDGPFQQWKVWYQQSFLTHSQCDLLIDQFELNKHKTMKSPDGHPFFDNRVLWFDSIPVDSRECKAIMQSSRRGMIDAIRKFYKEPLELFSDTIQLVKWGADQAMPVHADNVHFDGTPHLTPHRDFAAIVYLNDDFLDGFIYFEEFRLAIRPKKGLLLAFPTGMRYRHGVTAISEGKRYTMPAWFTRDISKRDRSELEDY